MAVYETMKNSNLPWIGVIPSHWEITRIKELMQNVSEKNHPDATVLSLYREYGVLPKDSRDDNHNVTSLDTASYKFVRIGELVINKMKAWQGSFGVSEYEGIVSPAYYVCRFTSDKINAKYFHYLIRCKAYVQEFERLSTGMRIGQWDLGIDDFMCTPAIIPPVAEQSAIAAYLDDQCAKIDTLISEAKASIEEYKKWKASVITEAVTEGLNSSTDMIQSDLPIYSRRPGSWLYMRVKDVATVMRGGSPRPIEEYLTDDVDGYNWIKIGDTTKGQKYITSTQQKIKPSGLSKTRLVHKGDLLLTNSMSFGKPYILAIDGCIHDGWVCLSDIHTVSKEYLYYFLCSELCMMQFHIQVAGGVVQNLNVDKIGCTKIFVPTEKEQEDIVQYLDKTCGIIEALIDEKQALISDMERYKYSLIYETVTGKRKVV